MNLNCYFCGEELQASKVSPTILEAVCPFCPEVCTTTKSFVSEVYFGRILFEYKEKEYSAIYTSHGFHIDLMEYSDVDGQLQPRKLVMELSFEPRNITPHNIKQKFPTLVVFS